MLIKPIAFVKCLKLAGDNRQLALKKTINFLVKNHSSYPLSKTIMIADNTINLIYGEKP